MEAEQTVVTCEEGMEVPIAYSLYRLLQEENLAINMSGACFQVHPLSDIQPLTQISFLENEKRKFEKVMNPDASTDTDS